MQPERRFGPQTGFQEGTQKVLLAACESPITGPPLLKEVVTLLICLGLMPFST